MEMTNGIIHKKVESLLKVVFCIFLWMPFLQPKIPSLISSFLHYLYLNSGIFPKNPRKYKHIFLSEIPKQNWPLLPFLAIGPRPWWATQRLFCLSPNSASMNSSTTPPGRTRRAAHDKLRSSRRTPSRTEFSWSDFDPYTFPFLLHQTIQSRTILLWRFYALICLHLRIMSFNFFVFS